VNKVLALDGRKEWFNTLIHSNLFPKAITQLFGIISLLILGSKVCVSLTVISIVGAHKMFSGHLEKNLFLILRRIMAKTI
jgi:hypothetical protein